MESCVFCQGMVTPSTHRCQQCGREQPPLSSAAPMEAAAPALSISCPNCGDVLPHQARFCGRCGQPLAPSPEGLPPAHPVAERAEPDTSLAPTGTHSKRRGSSPLFSLLPTKTARKPSGFQGALAPQSSDVFISYSRKDTAFVRQLAEALAAANRQAWVDWQDIPPTAKWLHEIYAGIESATTFVFVLSPDSIASPVCMQEVAHAVENKKRIIPLVYRPVDPQEVNDSLRELNWIFFTPQDRFEPALQELLFALDTDLAYWHQAARLLTRAKEWELKGRTAGVSLRGQELSEAERWLAEGATKQPSPNKLQIEFITASRRAASTRQRRTISGLSVALAVLAALTVLSFVLYQVSQAQKAQIQQQNAQIRHELAEVLARGANVALSQNQPVSALLQAAQSLHNENNLDTRNALFDALSSYANLDTILTTPPLPAAPGQKQDTGVAAATFNPVDNSVIALTRDGHVTRWDMITHQPQPLFVLAFHYPYTRSPTPTQLMVVSPDGSRLAVYTEGDAEFKLEMWSLTTKTQLWQTPINDFATSLLFTPDGSQVRLALDAQVLQWNSATGQMIGTPLLFPGVSERSVLSPDGARLATVTCATELCDMGWSLSMWDVASQRLLWQQSCKGVAQIVKEIMSPDGKRLLTTSCNPDNNNSNEFQLWDTATGQPLRQFNGDPFMLINSMVLSPDGTQVAFGGCPSAECLQGQLILQPLDPLNVDELPEGEPLAGPIPRINSVGFSPDGNKILSLDESDHLFLWNVRESSFGKQLRLSGTDALSSFRDLSYSPDGKYLMGDTGFGGNSFLWDVAHGKPFVTIPLAWSPHFSPDGKYFVAYTPPASTSPLADPNAFAAFSLYDVATHHLIRSFSNDECKDNSNSAGVVVYPTFSSDSKELLEPCFQDNPIRVQINAWDIGSGKLVEQQRLPGSEQLTLYASNGNIDLNVVRVSPDAKLAAISSGDNTLYLWNIASGQLRKLKPGGGEAITDVAFSPDSTEVAITDEEKTTLWKLDASTSDGPFFSITRGADATFFSQDGKWLASVCASACYPGSAALIDLRQHQPQVFVQFTELDPNSDVGDFALNPTGAFLAWARTFYSVITIRSLTPSIWEQQACQILALSLQSCATAPIPSV